MRIFGLLAGLSLLLASGCIFSPERKPPKPEIPFEYPAPYSPAQALQNVIDAYNNRDSIETKAMYDPLYTGVSTDPSLPTQIPTLTWQSEVYHVKRLHDDQNILTVSLDLGPAAYWQRLPGLSDDPPGAAVIPITYFSLTFTLTGNQSYAFFPATMEYAFKPNVQASGDTLWTVIRWTEIRTGT